MRALTIHQPWAWLIVRPDITKPHERSAMYAVGKMKDIENRSWHSNVRGRILVHAGVSYSPRTHDYLCRWIREHFDIHLPAFHCLPRGGVVGEVEITDCVRESTSRWKDPDSFGLVLRNSAPREFVPFKGKQRWFDVPDELLA